MYRVAGSRLRALKRNACETGVLGAATRLASTAVAKPSSGGSGFFGWLTRGSQKLPSLELPLEGVTLPPPLPDKVEAGETRITTLPNGVKIASETSPNPAASIGLYVECGSMG
ncbi:probable mitochondrial-processing peptidase subunit alpha-1, mitochondrial [Asparagus officinalis]|uniref:probable mitochondrial-processing peptidase subunit alpha-1, mitochondrial n=1 Tax=Asparagus officinalis TaxID=4686 RepID=UPI00098DFA1F|nr:probable mitochondrial-processing peptidase subunit alpha-1, mitochondrial [Asparagus officinalis]